MSEKEKAAHAYAATKTKNDTYHKYLVEAFLQGYTKAENDRLSWNIQRESMYDNE